MIVPRLPLRDELFLLSHNDDTGTPHIHRQSLATGLAGAVLIDLFLAGRIALHPHDDRPVDDRWLRLHTDQPVGDLIADTALASIRHGRTAPPVKAFLRGFADDLYERTRAGLVAAGILRSAGTRQRRFTRVEQLLQARRIETDLQLPRRPHLAPDSDLDPQTTQGPDVEATPAAFHGRRMDGHRRTAHPVQPGFGHRIPVPTPQRDPQPLDTLDASPDPAD